MDCDDLRGVEARLHPARFLGLQPAACVGPDRRRWAAAWPLRALSAVFSKQHHRVPVLHRASTLAGQRAESSQGSNVVNNPGSAIEGFQAGVRCKVAANRLIRAARHLRPHLEPSLRACRAREPGLTRADHLAHVRASVVRGVPIIGRLTRAVPSCTTPSSCGMNADGRRLSSQAIKRITGYTPRCFRPPYGSVRDALDASDAAATSMIASARSRWASSSTSGCA